MYPTLVCSSRCPTPSHLVVFRFVVLLPTLTIVAATQASLNFDDPTLKALLESLPEAPAMAQRKCLQRCGLGDDDELSYNYEY